MNPFRGVSNLASNVSRACERVLCCCNRANVHIKRKFKTQSPTAFHVAIASAAASEASLHTWKRRKDATKANTLLGATRAFNKLKVVQMSDERESKASAAIQQPPWQRPAGGDEPQLKLYNSLTRTKVPFVPARGRDITWYNCGPTVYDAAHIGHARLYLSVDVLRRILERYFNYNVHFVMNITDIDDKIILRARQQHLFEEFRGRYLAADDSLQADASLPEFLEAVRALWKNYVSRAFGDKASETWDSFHSNTLAAIRDASAAAASTLTPEERAKRALKLRLAHEAHVAISNVEVNAESKDLAASISHICEVARDILSVALDNASGNSVTDHAIFARLSSYWEREFMKDMASLNVLPPDVLTRVSEYVPEIIDFVKRIMERGFAYEAEGSVYFDTAKFHKSPGHHYAKLEPWSAASASAAGLVAEGEGDLSTKLTSQKRSPADFALWKRSKAGEPAWDSPWGAGRPGWHIECSAMAGHVFGSSLDIHSGGIDLAFPHHDNELAQSEASCEGCTQWVNYFLHIGHLHVDGQKMSKSLKNFTTIREALERVAPNTLRALIVMQHWQGVMDFKESAMAHVYSAEQALQNFATNVKAIIADAESSNTTEAGIPTHDFRVAERALMDHIFACQKAVHEALCDNINTPGAMEALLELVNRTNSYIAGTNAAVSTAPAPNTQLLRKAARYVTRITSIFGLTDPALEIGYGWPNRSGQAGAGSTTAESREAILMPHLKVLAKFRDDVRAAARENNAKAVLGLCDQLRDVQLLELGVQLDDRDPARGALVKFIDASQIARDKEDRARRDAEREASRRVAAVNQLRRLYAGRTEPAKLFTGNTKEYSAFNEAGIPTADAEGNALPKSRAKRLAKEHEQQVKLHNEYLAALKAGSIDWEPLKQAFKDEGRAWEGN